MNLNELKSIIRHSEALIFLEKVFPHSVRRVCLKTLSYILVIGFAFASNILWQSPPYATGLFFIGLSIYLLLLALEAFYYSYFFDRRGPEDFLFEISSIIFSSTSKDLVKSFVKSNYGAEAILRSGVDSKDLKQFLNTRKFIHGAGEIQFDRNKDIVTSYIEGLMHSDAEFENFLLAHNVTPEILVQSFCWISSLVRKSIDTERWWSQDRLERVEPIGRSWSYGTAYKLERYSTPLRFSVSQQEELHPKEIITLEVVLSKSSSGNALIVGEEGSGKMEVVEGLARRIARKESSRHLQNMVLRVLFLDAILSSEETRGGFERLLIGIIDDMVKAGNVILIIPDFDSLYSFGQSLGSDVSALLAPYLMSPLIHVVALSDTEQFHAVIETKSELTGHFDIIRIGGTDKKIVSTLLLERVVGLEDTENVIFTYPSVKTAIDSASRYFVGKPIYSVAGNILIEAIAHVRSEGRNLITADDILAVVGTQTGIPMGEVSQSEKEKFTNLESLLHERVIGQDEAIKGVSNALRRARSGIGNPNRPMGSFLFLGPTGVGKTETAKALAEIFFGASSSMVRLDMSEYDTPDALNRLIGGYDSETPGTLASLAREHQYGVLLLDEFEKTNERVMDLFLQILDEGIFSDAVGRKISVRNMIIIATSNAGSERIFKAMEEKRDLALMKDQIVDEIIQERIFKPELINRFDGVVLFHGLTEEDLKKIADILLKRLEWRLKEKGMTLEINETLIDFLVRKGTDPKFGARPLGRAMQDTIEKIIADKIISGEWKPGSRVSFSKADFEKTP